MRFSLELCNENRMRIKPLGSYNLLQDYLLDLTGLWFNPLEYYSRLSRSVRAKLERIVDFYCKLRLSINRFERDYIFIAVALSRRTDYHRNTVRWCESIFGKISDVKDVLDLDLSKVSRSYQVAQLKYSLKDYLSVKSILEKLYERNDIVGLRRILLGIKWFGPKSTDAFILFTSRLSQSTPCDIHYRRFTRFLNLIDYEYLPNKSMCIRYSCDSCPFSNKCLYSLSIKYFGPLSGWIQTVAYVHDKNYCSRGRCTLCPFMKDCSLPASHKL